MKTIFVSIVMIAALCSVAFAECSASDKKALEAFDRAWGMAGEKGDKAALNSLYADEYMGLPEMMGKAATIDRTMAIYEADKANPAGADKITHDRYLITCTPASATITHRNIVSVQNGTSGRPEVIWTRSVHFLEKRGGNWQVVSNATHDMNDYMSLAYMEQDWNDANQNRDKAWWEKNYANDFSSISSTSGKLFNKAQDIADSLADKGTIELTETSDLNVRVDRSFALVTGVYRTKGKDEKGVAYDRRIRFTDAFIKRDGRWQIWSTSGTVIK